MPVAAALTPFAAVKINPPAGLMRKHGRPDPQGSDSMVHGSPDGSGSSSGSEGGGGGRAGRKRSRSQGAAPTSAPGSNEDQEAKTRRQQMLNKAAQQRYRQRRKERQHNIEVTLGQMQEQNSDLQAQVMALEAALMSSQMQQLPGLPMQFGGPMGTMPLMLMQQQQHSQEVSPHQQPAPPPLPLPPQIGGLPLLQGQGSGEVLQPPMHQQQQQQLHQHPPHHHQLQQQQPAFLSRLGGDRVSLLQQQQEGAASDGGSGSPAPAGGWPPGAAGALDVHRSNVAALEAFVVENQICELQLSGEEIARSGCMHMPRSRLLPCINGPHQCAPLHAPSANTTHRNSTGEQLPPDLASDLRSLLHAAADTCAAALDVASPDVAWPLGGPPKPDETAGPPVAAAAAAALGAPRRRRAGASAFDKQRWLQVLADVSLSDDQMRELLQLRGRLLEALGRTLAERRALAERLLAGEQGGGGQLAVAFLAC